MLSQGWKSYKPPIYSKGTFYSIELSHFSDDGENVIKVNIWDPCLHFIGSLEKVAASFKIEQGKKESFSHEQYQHFYDTEGFDGLVKRKKEIETYLKQDVNILWQIFQKIPDTNKQYCTPASMAWNTFKKGNKYKIPGPKSELIPFFRKAVLGGRTQAFVRGKINQKLRMLDVVSLYPSAMFNHRYPVANLTETDKEVKGKLGIYTVHINHQKATPTKDGFVKPPIVPMKTKGEPLDWSYTGAMDTVCSTVIIDMLRRQLKMYRSLHILSYTRSERPCLFRSDTAERLLVL